MLVKRHTKRWRETSHSQSLYFFLVIRREGAKYYKKKVLACFHDRKKINTMQWWEEASREFFVVSGLYFNWLDATNHFWYEILMTYKKCLLDTELKLY